VFYVDEIPPDPFLDFCNEVFVLKQGQVRFKNAGFRFSDFGYPFIAEVLQPDLADSTLLVTFFRG